MDDNQTLGRQSGWAASSIASPELMTAFQVGLPVRLVATPRQLFETCGVDEMLTDVVRKNKKGFDFFPVLDGANTGSERIVGFVDLGSLDQGEIPGCRVRDRMLPLHEDNLIGADADILSFVTSADGRPFRLVVSGARIDGLVSLSDMQKLPVRVALFALITHLEMTMADAIRREFDGASNWTGRLSPERRGEVEVKWRSTKRDDNWVDELLFTEFADKSTIIRKSGLFTGSKQAFKTAMTQAEKLRNNVAHANEYAKTRKAAAEVCVTVRLIEDWIERLSKWPSTQAT